MKRVLILILILGACAAGFRTVAQRHEATQGETANAIAVYRAATNEVNALEQERTALRKEIAARQRQIHNLVSQPRINSKWIEILDEGSASGRPVNWSALREPLGLEWDSSTEFVLVQKQVLKKIGFPVFSGSRDRVTDIAAEILSISTQQRSEINEATRRVTEWVLSQVQRAQPSGDIVARYIFPADAQLHTMISNRLALEFNGILGEQRASSLMEHGWYQFRASLPQVTEKTVTMTIRQRVSDGEPDLVCEMVEGPQIPSVGADGKPHGFTGEYVHPVRYAHYPSAWFLTLFPGGWEDLAQREGFELPKRFHNQ